MREEVSRCVVSLATQRTPFPSGLVRLERSLGQVGFSGGFRAWSPGDFPGGCPSHLEVPFAFKPFCLAEARAQGWRSVLWLDARCFVVRSLDSIFEAIETDGYVLYQNASHLGEWASDQALSAFGMSRQHALSLPEVNAAAIGLSFVHPIGVEFLESWHEAARHEVPFRGISEPFESWKDYEDVKWNVSGRASRDPRVHGHRHDQTIAGILAHRLGMELTLDGLEDAMVLETGAPFRPDTAIVIDREMSERRVHQRTR
jgi:hypothetical protein